MSGGAPEPTQGGRALRLVLVTTLFLAAGALGRITVIEGANLSVIWPAAGVAALWIGTGNRRTWPVDLTALAVATYVINNVTGASPSLALLLVATNLLQVFLFVAAVRRWVPGLWGFGGSRPLTRLADLGLIALAAVLTCFAAAAAGTIGVRLIFGHIDPGTFPVWWGRNTIALEVITTLGILVGQPLATAGSRRRALRRAAAALVPRSAGRTAEVLALVVASLALYLVLFLEPSAKPLAFLMLVLSVWAGLRFAPLAVTVHGLAMGVAGTAFTLAGEGPFADIDSLHYRAVVAQIFFAMTVLTGLALAFSRMERVEAYRALREARRAADERANLLGVVLDTMHEGMVVLEEGGAILVRNEAANRLMGLQTISDHVRSAEVYKLFHANGEPVTDEELPGIRALQGVEVPPEDLQLRSEAVPEGRVLEIAALPLADDDPDAPRRALVNIRDVTVDRQHRDTLLNFAGVVAHDLFSPLSLVNGWAETLADAFDDGPVPPAVGLPMVSRIHDAAAHMRMFIGDLMAYTVARDQSLHPGPIDLSGLARSVAEPHAARPDGPVVSVTDGLLAWADPGLIRQLLDNLLGNAIKYVTTGTRPEIRITGTAHGDWLEVRVTDNGIGIPANQREAVFASFHRLHEDGYQGTGLGLAICRRIVDRHGGSIWVEDGPHGRGSTFVFMLPRHAGARTAPKEPEEPAERPVEQTA